MKLLVVVLIIISFPVRSALAQCTGPYGVEGEIVFNSSYNVPQYCDSSDDWIAMVGADPYRCAAGIQSCGGKPTERVTFAVIKSRGNFGGVSGADAYCQAEAESNGLRGVYYAWLAGSDPNTAPASRFEQSSVPYVRVDGLSIADDWSDLTDGNIKRNFSLSDGSGLNGSNASFTNVLTDGTQDTSANDGHCDDWTNPSAGGMYNRGDRRFADSRWTERGTFNCAASAYVYCFEQSHIRRTETVPNGLVGHWRLDETSGTTVYDHSITGNHGTNSSTPSRPGVIGNSFFQEFNTNVTLVNAAPYNNLDEITIAWWGYPERIDGNMWTWFGAGVRINNFSSNDFRFVFLNWSGSEGNFRTTGINPFAIDTWRHYALTYSYNNTPGTQPKLYINGVEQVGNIDTLSTPSGSFSASTDTEVRIGHNGASDQGFNGRLDDVRIYNRILDENEIQELYQARDGIRYDGNLRVIKFFDGNKYVSMTPEWSNVTKGLVGHWKLDETEGTTIKDYSANGNDGTASNGLDTEEHNTRGAVGGALNFYGNDSQYKVITSNQSYYDFGATQDFSTSVWMKTDQNFSEEKYIFVKFGGGSSPGFLMQISNNEQAEARIRDGTNSVTVTGASTLNDGDWHHVAATFDRDGDLKLYIDGVEDNSASISSVGSITNVYGLNIGGRNAGTDKHFAGAIDDVRLYDRVLTAAEVQQLYNMGTPIGASTALPQGCPNIGDVCDDGTIFAGLSPDGNMEMFIASSVINVNGWNNGNTSGYVATNLTSDITGEANTNSLVTYDSDSDTADFQPHLAAQACYDLNRHGADDWYLPAHDELTLIWESLFDNDPTDGNSDFPINENIYGFPSGRYYSSTEFSDQLVKARDFENSTGTPGNLKDRSRVVLCVRKGPAPRCASPYGMEGQMVYNATYDVVQFCDGARWRAIGKYAP